MLAFVFLCAFSLGAQAVRSQMEQQSNSVSQLTLLKNMRLGSNRNLGLSERPVFDVLSEPAVALQVFSLSGLGLIGLAISPPMKKHKLVKQALIVAVISLCAFCIGYFVGMRVCNSSRGCIPSAASYTIYKEGSTYYAKNAYGAIDFSGTDVSVILQSAINATSDGGIIFIKDNINLTKDVIISNKSHMILQSNDAVISGGKIRIYGDTCYKAERNYIIYLRFSGASAGISIENSLGSVIENCDFNGCDVGIEIINTKNWTELTEINNVYFNNCRKGIIFRTPVPPGTESYVNTRIDHAFFNLMASGDIGIDIEQGANIGDSLFSNIKIWLHEDNQVGIRINGSCNGAVIIKPSFESFVSSPTNLYGIQLLQNASYPPYLILPSWLGEFTSRINNPYSTWIYGLGASIKNSADIQIGVNDAYGETAIVLDNRMDTAIIAPRVHISVGGTFATGENVTVKIIFEFMDGSELSKEISWTSVREYWLSDADLMNLLASASPLWAIKAQAKTNQATTSVTVTVEAYGFG
jgi:hypothetical protein